MVADEKHKEEENGSMKVREWWGLSVGLILGGQSWLEAGPQLYLKHPDDTLAVWDLDGSEFLGSRVLEESRSKTGSSLVGVGDFDGDGEVDWVLSHPDNGLRVASQAEFALTDRFEIDQVEGKVLLVYDCAISSCTYRGDYFLLLGRNS